MYTVESHFDTNACDGRPIPSYGIPQIQIQTAQLVVNSWGSYRITASNLRDYPGLAIRISCAHFRHLLKTYKGDYIRAIRAYNAGETAVNTSERLPGMPYFKKVLHQYELYKLN